jgi:Zinc carboxypeptidase
VKRASWIVACLLALGLLPSPVTVAAQATCDPTGTIPQYAGTVPTAKDVIGFQLGRREVTVDQAWAYLDAVDAASDRVSSGTYATSVLGRPLRYAVVGNPENVTPEGLEAIRQNVLRMRDPSTPVDVVAALAATTPAFLYIAGNVHGSEESGADAALSVLYDLADRTDCAARQILDNAVVFVLPIQNPDGREADTRRNAYGIDLNRDGFARTQPETDGRIELLREYPPLLFVDAHEFSYYRSFFPPNDDPIYAEVSGQALGWINELYGPALAEEFRARDWGYFNYTGYDLFAPIYGDTVPVIGFQAAGLTIETYNGAPIDLRVEKNRVEFWVLLSQAVLHRTQLLVEQHDAYVDAVREGRRGTLEGNVIQAPGSTQIADVPSLRIRHYFVLRSPNRAYEEALLVRRLQRMDVQVYRLDEPLAVPDYLPYVGQIGERTLPAGTYWIPMAQPQKHWIQAMLNRDTYVPVRKTYDITGWSGPLLMNLDGGSSGARLEPTASLVPPVDEPTFGAGNEEPRVGILALSNAVYAFEGTQQLRYLFEQVWGGRFRMLSTDDVRHGALRHVDVLVVPMGGVLVGERRLGAKGEAAIVDWVRDGGRYIGYKYGGALIAERMGITTARFRNSPYSIPGSLIRVRLDPHSPLADGVGRWVWVMFDDDDTLGVRPAVAPMRYPELGRAFEVSGASLHTQKLAGQPAAVDEPFGDGRVVLFPYNLNFRLLTQGTQRILWNAIFGPDPS